MSSDLVRVLERLNRKMGKYAARSERVQANSADPSSARLWEWDAKTARLMQSYVRYEIRRAKDAK